MLKNQPIVLKNGKTITKNIYGVQPLKNQSSYFVGNNGYCFGITGTINHNKKQISVLLTSQGVFIEYEEVPNDSND